MQNHQKAKEKLLDEIDTLERKIQELRGLAGKNSNGVLVEDLIRRTEKTVDNFKKKIESIKKMASKK